ncbi:MAG: YqhA family protein [Rhodospirillales bacterium]|nr:YqhA family protein [Rhodospirillales bacterium]
MDRTIEALMLGLRWLLLPLYLALLATLLAIYAMVGKQLWHLAADFAGFTDIDLVLLLLSLLDLVLLANLLVMVAVSSYESYISRIDAPPGHSPEWLGKLDSSNVKVKVAVSVVMISMIHVLRAFMEGEAERRLLTLAAVHIVFVLSALGIALIDRAHRPAAAH